jgi:DNA modification methylase
MTGSTPTPHYQTEHVTLYHGDCSDILAQLPDNSVDSIVTDPPYGIEFMGKQWDAFAPEVAASTAARTGTKKVRNDGGMHEHSVLSGGPLPVFGGNRSRTFVCVLCGKRDQFRNPHACDDQPGARWESVVINEHGAPAAAIGFQQWCEQWARECLRVLKPGGHLLAFGGARTYHRLACAIEDAGFDIRDSIHWVYGSGFPKSLNISKQLDKTADADAAKQWEGWGTALKPAHEPIVLARKPTRDSITRNVTRYGTGALNIDGCRIETTDRFGGGSKGSSGFVAGYDGDGWKPGNETGRWPANVIHDGSSEVLEHFPTTTTWKAKNPGAYETESMFGVGGRNFGDADSGSAGRFFNATPYTELDGASFVYCPKAGTRERNAGLDHLDETRANHHPTVKPLALMRHLIRLITPPGGTVLEPFAGSGTTLAAATLEGFHAIGIELTADYLPIITGRIQWAAEQHANETPKLF